MADINITGSSSNPIANNYTATSSQTTVSFHSANHAVQVCFTNSSTFDMSGVEIPKGGQPTSLPIKNRVGTDFTTNPEGTTCPPPRIKEGGPYTITIGSTPGPHPPGHGHHKK